MNPRLVWDLARFFLRTAPLRTGAAVIAAVVLLTTVVLTTAQAFRLDPQQQIAQTLGVAPARIDLPSTQILGAVERPTTEALGRVRTTYQVRPHSGGPASVILEDDWGSRPFPERLDLAQGRWPGAPTEVATSPALADALPVGSSVEVVSGGPTLRVVGIVHDRFTWRAEILYAAPGTAAAFNVIPGAVAERADVEVSTSLYGDQPSAEAMQALAEEVADIGSVDVVTAQELKSRAYTDSEEVWTLALLAPTAALIVAFAVAARFFRRVRTSTVQVGVTPRQIDAASLIAMALGATLAVAVGLVLGFVATWAARPLLALLGQSDLGPVRDPVGLAVRMLLVAVVILIAACVITLAARRIGSMPVRPAVWQGLVALVLVASGGVVAQGADLDVGQVTLAAALVGLALVALSRFVLHSVARRLSHGAGPFALGMRRIATDRAAARAMQAAAGILVLAFSATVLTSSAITSVNTRTASLVPHHRIFIDTSSSEVDQEHVVAAVQSSLGLADPQYFSDAIGGVTLQQGPTLVVDSIHDLEAILGVTLTAPERGLLETGGTLRTSGDATSVDFDDYAGRLLPLPVGTRLDLDPSWRTIDGFLLQQTADALELQTTAPTAVLTANDEQLSRLPEVTASLGLQPDWIRAYAEPDTVTAPLASVITGAVISLIGAVLMIGYAVQVARLTRPTMAALTAIGAPGQWASRVVLTQVATVVIIATLTATLASVVGATAARTLSGFSFPIAPPWASLSVVVGTILLASLVGAGVAARRVRPGERFLA